MERTLILRSDLDTNGHLLGVAGERKPRAQKGQGSKYARVHEVRAECNADSLDEVDWPVALEAVIEAAVAGSKRLSCVLPIKKKKATSPEG